MQGSHVLLGGAVDAHTRDDHILEGKKSFVAKRKSSAWLVLSALDRETWGPDTPL